MLLENQVCTYQQAERLYQMGILQKSLFYTRLDGHFTSEKTPITSVNQFSAFTVAELCKMVLCRAVDGSGYNIVWEAPCTYKLKLRGESFRSFNNQAHALAYLLILLLEKKIVTAISCNERLTTNPD